VGEMLCWGGGGGEREEGEGGGGGAHVRARVRACTRRLTCPLLPDANFTPNPMRTEALRHSAYYSVHALGYLTTSWRLEQQCCCVL
jgi:hypothetical protein